MIQSDPIYQLKSALLKVEKIGDIHRLIVDSTYEEIEELYNQLTQKDRAKINEIYTRDTQRQLAATLNKNYLRSW